MKKKGYAILFLAVLTLGILGIVYSADATSGYLGQYNAAFGTNESCSLCHTSPPALNSTGQTFKNSGFDLCSIGPPTGPCAPPPPPPPPPPPTSDTVPPTVTAFSISSTASSLTVSITTLSATDNVGVTGYKVTEGSTAPSASATGWNASPPASYPFATAGEKTLYAWAKDKAGNVSLSLSATVTITLPPAADTIPPTITAFSLPSTSSSLTVPISAFVANDNVAVTGYMVTESSTAPSASATGWSGSPPASYTFATAGTKDLYAWAKDAAGNVSSSLSATVTVTSSSPTEEMSLWIGRWFKVTENNKGYNTAGSGLNIDQATFVGYLKFWGWDPVNKVLQGDRYEQDQTGQWISEPLILNFIAGNDLDFLCWSQATSDLAVGFAARIQGREVGGVLQNATFKTLGGYYMGTAGGGGGGSQEYWAGGLSISGSLTPEGKVPVPSSALVH